MTATVHEHKERPLVPWQEPVAFLRERQKSDCSTLLFSFLETFTSGVRRDRKENVTLHSYTVLDGDFSGCNPKVINGLIRKCLTGAFDSKSALFLNEMEPNYTIRARLFGVPDKEEGNPTDVASIQHYQKDRINPSTFKPLDYFAQKDAHQEFISVQIEVQMGDTRVPAAEYLCPYTRLSTADETIAELAQEEPTVQIRRMDKSYIEASLKHVAALFERIVKPAQAYTADTLRNDLALLAHTWTMISPFEEESRAVVDLLQTTLAALHGFQFKVKADTSIYETALSKPYFPIFLKNYNNFTKLTR